MAYFAAGIVILGVALVIASRFQPPRQGPQRFT